MNYSLFRASLFTPLRFANNFLFSFSKASQSLLSTRRDFYHWIGIFCVDVQCYCDISLSLSLSLSLDIGLLHCKFFCRIFYLLHVIYQFRSFVIIHYSSLCILLWYFFLFKVLFVGIIRSHALFVYVNVSILLF